MRNALKRNTPFARIEFWAFTTIFAFVLFFFVMDGFDGGNAPYQSGFEEAGVPFEFYKHFFIPQLIRNISLFLFITYLNFIVIPQLVSKQRIALNVTLVVLIFLLLTVIFGSTDYYLRAFVYRRSISAGIQNMLSQGYVFAAIVYAVFFMYTAIKYISLYLLAVSAKIESKYRFIRPEAMVATFIWLVILLFLIRENGPGFIIAGWIMAVPSAILLYLAGFYTLIPTSLNKKYPFITYAFKNAILLLVFLMAWGFIVKLVIGGVLGGDKAPLVALWLFNSVLQLFVTVPVTWWLYKRQMKGVEQLNVLKKELGQSNASFDFLRSQINPHFLFNALNTLYGTAIQENAERTSEGIQKLGDMMRFMLRENMQDTISLQREVEYLYNYISLQKLRTAAHPDIEIDMHIEEPVHTIQIAPMLLIPFVENAFKHGISFREPSHIKITLEVKDNTLHFDVYNSKHTRHDHDPEKDNSGIGLENVKQRLNLSYPNKHALMIRNMDKEFLVHLTVQLAKSA